eukprot:643132-Amphidinium_carterae.1
MVGNGAVLVLLLIPSSHASFLRGVGPHAVDRGNADLWLKIWNVINTEKARWFAHVCGETIE